MRIPSIGVALFPPPLHPRFILRFMPPPTIPMEGFDLPTGIRRGMEERGGGGWAAKQNNSIARGTEEVLYVVRSEYVPQLNHRCTETARVSPFILILDRLLIYLFVYDFKKKNYPGGCTTNFSTLI